MVLGYRSNQCTVKFWSKNHWNIPIPSTTQIFHYTKPKYSIRQKELTNYFRSKWIYSNWWFSRFLFDQNFHKTIHFAFLFFVHLLICFLIESHTNYWWAKSQRNALPSYIHIDSIAVFKLRTNLFCFFLFWNGCFTLRCCLLLLSKLIFGLFVKTRTNVSVVVVYAYRRWFYECVCSF